MDDGDQTVTRNVEQRLGDVRGLVDQTGADVARQLAEHGQILSQRVDAIDMKMVDRAMAMEEQDQRHTTASRSPISTQRSAASVPASTTQWALCRNDSSISRRKLLEAGDRMDRLAEDVSKVDEEAINVVKEQLSSAVGEAMLVRIEVDRFMATQEERFDATALRMSEIEAQLADTMDVGEAVQLERLEEIERALIELNPNQFVRKVEASSGSGFTAPSDNPTLPASSTN